jgi:hypothetical protein
MWETVLAHAVRQRGAEVVFASCGGRLPICDAVSINSGLKMPCLSCAGYATDAIEAAGFQYRLVDGLTSIKNVASEVRVLVDSLENTVSCIDYCDGDFPVGRLVKTSVSWFLSKGTLDNSAETLKVFRRFLISGTVLHRAFTALLDEQAPDRIFLLNGLFFAERILCELATARGIPVTRYERGVRENTLIMSRWDAHADDLDPSDEEWNATEQLSISERAEVEDYLASREHASGKGGDDFATMRRELSLSQGHPVVALFTNILWDSAIQDKDVAFPSMQDWLRSAVEWAIRRTDIDLVIRIHPAEVDGNHRSREVMSDVIDDMVQHLPSNVRVIPADMKINSYTLMDMATVGLVYTSTTGLEMATRGRPVVVAGDAHYRGRGFTIDPMSGGAYWRAIDDLLAAPRDQKSLELQREIALRYAHLFFFRFHHELRMVRENGHSQPRVVAASQRALSPGHDAVVDRMVDAIFDGTGALVSPSTATRS